MSILHKIAVLAEHDISLITDSDMSSVQEELSLIWAKIWQWRKDEYERQKIEQQIKNYAEQTRMMAGIEKSLPTKDKE